MKLKQKQVIDANCTDEVTEADQVHDMKLKKQKHVIDANCTDEVTEADQNNSLSEGNNNSSVELVHKFGSKDEASLLKLGSGLKTAESAGDECDLNFLGDLAVSGSETEGRVRPARGRPARGRPARVRPAQVRPARVQPARSCKSFMVDTSRLHTFMLPCHHENSIADMEANISPDITGRRSKRLRKSADNYRTHDLGSPSNNKISIDRNSEEDGDEHLPPLKRARFRMGFSLHRPSSAEEQIDGQVEDKQPPLSEISNNQPFSGLVAGEAALPPSKRRHRALEAISVNAAQDSQRSSDGPAVTKTSVIEYGSSSSRECAKATLESKEGAEVGSTKLESFNEHFIHSDASVAEVSGQPLEEVPASCIPPCSLTYEACEDAKKALDCGDGEQNVTIQAPQLDDEAALPPSKRRHCVLGVISVNAAQNSQRSCDVPAVTKTSDNEYFSSSSGECAEATLESKEGADVGSTKLESLDEHLVHSDASVAEVSGKPLEEVPASCIPPSSLTDEACKDAKEALDCGDGEQNVKIQAPQLDDEAALPPSKRRHRALEAISVNSAQDSRRSSDGAAVTKTSINEYCSSSGECAKATLESKEGAEVGSTKLESLNEHFVHSDASVAEVSGKPLEEVPTSCIPPSSLTHEACKDAEEALDCADGEQNVKVQAPHLDEAGTSLERFQGSPVLVMHLSNDSKPESAKLYRPFTEPEAQISKSLDLVSQEEYSPTSTWKWANSHLSSAEDNSFGTTELGQPSLLSAEKFANSHLSSAEDNSFGTIELRHPPLHEEKQNDAMSGIVKESGSAIKNPNAISFPAPAEVLITAHQGQNLSDSSYIYDDHLGDKAVSTMQSSSTVTEGVASVSHASPLGAHPYVDKPNLAGKWSRKTGSDMALASFEAILGALNESNESISEATLIAIDCLKLGVATKVVEILTRELEIETSLHKKLNLFFLVNSITQYSRRLKGDLGRIYPSAVGAVLPRLLSAAAPPGSSSLENSWQCLNVLRIWQQEKIIQESIIADHIRELGLRCCSSSSGGFSHSLRREMAFDQCGSNSNIQLSPIFAPPLPKDIRPSSCPLAVLSPPPPPPPPPPPRSAFPLLVHSLSNTQVADGAFHIRPPHHAPTYQFSYVQADEQRQSPLPVQCPTNIQVANGAFQSRPPHPAPTNQFSYVQADQRRRSPPPVQSLSNTQVADGAFHIRPPHHAPTYQFSYVQADEQRQSPPPVQCPTNIQVANGAFQSRPPHPAPANQFSFVQADQRRRSPLPVQSLSNTQVADGAFHIRSLHRAPTYQFSYVQADEQRQSPPPVQCPTNIQVADGAFQSRPPHPAPTNQFSYVQADQWRRSPPPVQSLSNTQVAYGAFHIRPPHHAPTYQFSYVHADEQRQSRPPVQCPTNIQVADGVFQSRPPHHAPTDQFSYVQDDQRRQSRRDVLPHPNPNRPPAAPVSDPTTQPNGSYRFGNPPTKPASPVYMWAYNPWAISPTQYLPQRPPPGGPFPEASRGPIYSRPK